MTNACITLTIYHFSGLSFVVEVNFWLLPKTVVFCDLFIIIIEWDRTLYVGLAHAVPPTNTNFRLTFLLTRLQETLYGADRHHDITYELQVCS